MMHPCGPFPSASNLVACLKNKWKKNRKIVLLIAISLFVTAVALTLSITLTYVYILKDVSYNVPLEGNPTTKISMVTHYIDVDPTAGTLTADWYPFVFNCSDPEEVVNIYFDPNTLIRSGGPSDQFASDKPPDRPTFEFTTKCQKDIRDSKPTFRTVSKLIGRDPHSNLKLKHSGPSLQWYPCDEYFVQISLFAQLNPSNASVGIITAVSLGSPANFHIDLDTNMSTNSEEGLFLYLTVKRSTAVKVLVGFIMAANWLTSVAFLFITIASFLWPEPVVKELFVIPIAALFAFTTIRSNIPGAPPGFGAYIDFVAILPNIALLASCSTILLLVVLFRRTCQRQIPDGPRHQADPERCQQCEATTQPQAQASTVQPQATPQSRSQATVQPRAQVTLQSRAQASNTLISGPSAPLVARRTSPEMPDGVELPNENLILDYVGDSKFGL